MIELEREPVDVPLLQRQATKEALREALAAAIVARSLLRNPMREREDVSAD